MANSRSSQQVSKFENQPWNKQFCANQVPMSYAGMEAFLKTWCHIGDDVTPFWDPDFSTAMCPVFIGDPGVGKSFRLWKFAERHGMEYRRVPMGDSQEEDNMGVISREVDENGHHKFTLPQWMPTEPPDSESKRGICFLDEIGTGENGHQNLTSIMLTDGYRNGIFGHTIKAGWFFFAAMNPDEIQHHLNNQLDDKLKDRLFPIYMQPTNEEILHTLVSLDKMPKLFHGFLRMQGNAAHIGAVSPRSWEKIGAFWFRHEAAQTMSSADALNTLRLMLPPGTVEAIATFMERGNDENAYPMSAKEIMNATGERLEMLVRRMKGWGKGGQDGLVAATGYDLMAFMHDPDFKFTDEQMGSTAKVLEVMPKTDQLQEIMDAASGQEKSHQLVKFLYDSDVAVDVAKMIERHKTHQKEVGR